MVTSNARYRPEIDGLRAVAVLAVVFSHAGMGFRGGYVGVDVFFVISGYLITSVILKDLDDGTFTLAGFWERRIRRIVPALAVLTLATLLVGAVLLLPSDYADLGKAAGAESALGANLYYWRTTGYFASAADEEVLLHTWSLAVEEQFYVIFPIVLLVIFRWPALRRRSVLSAIFGIGAALSLCLSCVTLSGRPAATFYLLPPRAWELLIGSSLALVPPGWHFGIRSIRETFALLGMSSILIPCFWYTDLTPFPGPAAFLPCIGAALVILADTHRPADSSLTQVGRCLALRPAVFIGLISYSLYLWHWPLFAFSKYWALAPLPLGFRTFLVSGAVILAGLSWRFVETPFRKRRIAISRFAAFRVAGAAIATVLVSGAFVVLMKGLPQRFSPTVLAFAHASSDLTSVHELSADDVIEGRLVRLGNAASDEDPKFLLWGDSFAMAAIPAFDLLLAEKGSAGFAATRSSTAPVLGYVRENDGNDAAESARFNDAVFSYIRAKKITDAVLVACWRCYENAGILPGSETLESGLAMTVERLVREGVRPWILLQVPTHSFNVPRALTRASLFQKHFDERILATPGAWNGLSGEDHGILRRIEASGGRLLDPRPAFLDREGLHYVVSADGRALYRDSMHLSQAGAELMLAPLLRKSFFTLPESR